MLLYVSFVMELPDASGCVTNVWGIEAEVVVAEDEDGAFGDVVEADDEDTSFDEVFVEVDEVALDEELRLSVGIGFDADADVDDEAVESA